MKAQVFLDWMTTTGCRTAADVSERLGLSRNIAQTMVATAKAGQDVETKQYVALAMTALANGLRPWDAYMR